MHIEKIDDINDVNFNAVDVKRCLRVMAGTINQIIDVLDNLQEEPYTADMDEDDEDSDSNNILTPEMIGNNLLKGKKKK